MFQCRPLGAASAPVDLLGTTRCSKTVGFSLKHFLYQTSYHIPKWIPFCSHMALYYHEHGGGGVVFGESTIMCLYVSSEHKGENGDELALPGSLARDLMSVVPDTTLVGEPKATHSHQWSPPVISKSTILASPRCLYLVTVVSLPCYT